MKFASFITSVLLVASLQLLECSGGQGGRGFEGGCQCRTGGWHSSCNYNSSTYQVGCPWTNRYRQCSNNSCTNQTCQANLVWNSTQGACAVCAAGYHVRADGQRCVCNQATTFNSSSNSCGPCPANATNQTDSCFCDNTTAFDPRTYACRACPPSSNLIDGCCKCLNGTFWNAGAWQCQACPGNLTTVSVGYGWFQSTKQVCTCPGANAIFYMPNVTCLTCPANSIPVGSGEFTADCVCTISGQIFDHTSGQCQCVLGVPLNAAGTACQYSDWQPDYWYGQDGSAVQGGDK